jgi:hypothetical protein
MADSFEDLITQIEREAEEEGPEAVAALRELQTRYELLGRLLKDPDDLDWMIAEDAAGNPRYLRMLVDAFLEHEKAHHQGPLEDPLP